MPRKTVEVRIQDEGRDKGKVFVIIEMGAIKAERWARRASSALAKGAASAVKLEIDENSGWAGLAAVGLGALGGIDWAEGDPLMDEMLTCVKIKPDPNNDFVRAWIEDDIEEIRTLVRLRQAVLELHGGFSFAGIVSWLRSLMTKSASSNTQTSPAPSGS